MTQTLLYDNAINISNSRFLFPHDSPIKSSDLLEIAPREHNSRPPPNLVHHEPEFEVEAVFTLRQLRRREREYLVKWKGYHPIEASWVNESDMEHAQEAIKEFHIRPAKKRHRT